MEVRVTGLGWLMEPPGDVDDRSERLEKKTNRDRKCLTPSERPRIRCGWMPCCHPSMRGAYTPLFRRQNAPRHVLSPQPFYGANGACFGTHLGRRRSIP